MNPDMEVAEVIYRAATDGTDQLRYVSGKDAEELLARRRVEEFGLSRGHPKLYAYGSLNTNPLPRLQFLREMVNSQCTIVISH